MTKWQHRERFLTLRACTGAGIFHAWHHLARYSFLKRVHRRFAAQIRRSHFCDIVQAAQDAARKHDMHRMFSLINRYAPKTARQRIQIRNQAGAIASPDEELTQLKQFVADIWGGPSQIPQNFAQAPGVPFSVSELATALSKIPTQRAVAHPFAPGIAWRCQSHVMAPILHQVLCQWWGCNPPYIPQIWRDGWMLLLGKPQKPPTSYYNLRPIALQDPVGKVLIGLLIQCACDDVRPLMLPWPIWAYLKQRSTLDAVCRVAFHCLQVSQLLSSQRPSPHARAADVPKFQFCGGVSIMLDLERAFDGVSRAKLFSQLHTLHIRPAVIQLLTQWHCDTQYHFQHGHDRIALPTGAGLRQGCKAAPGLWNFLMLLYLHRVSQHLPITWLRSHLNIYADDYQVGGLFYSASDLTKLLQAFGILLDTLREFSLRINTKKSAALLAIGGTSHRHQRAQFVASQNDHEQLRVPLPTGTEMLIPIQTQVKYLGTIMTYKDCKTATLKHRMSLARIAQRRLGRWLRGKHAFDVANRFQLWRSTVFPVLTYGLFSIGITHHGISILQKEMYKMLRQVACDHAFRTGHNNLQALLHHNLPTPLQQLRAAAKQLLRSITQRHTQLPADDITLQLPWDHLYELINALDSAQELSPQPVEPAELRCQSSRPDVFQCTHCDFLATDVASFRRHCTMIHGKQVHRQHFVIASQFTIDGLPECKYCHRTFTTWRRFQVHIERGCQELYSGPCAVETQSVLGQHAYMAGTTLAAGELVARGSTRLTDADLSNLRQTSFGPDLCQLVENRDWERLATLHDACQYLAKRCILCGLHYNRVQELNAHYRTMHGQYWEGIPQKAVYMSNTCAQERPCPFCGALFKSHLCPVWVQVTVLLLYGAAPFRDDPATTEVSRPEFRCEVCLELFSDQPLLLEHLAQAHDLHGMAFNVARDSVAGEPACAHCGTLYDNMSSLRSHINQSRCPHFRPEATAETLPMLPEWVQACTGGQMKVLFTNSRQRMVLTLHCQLCGVHYARATDLSCHLQSSHARLWRCAQQLTLVLVSIFYANGQCVCNPALHQNRLDHICLPLRQVSMLFHHMKDRLFAPFQASEHTLSLLLSSNLAPPTRFLFEQLAAQHCYERMWQDTQCLTALREQCLFCGCDRATSALPQHLREAHPCMHLALSFYMTLLAQLMQAHQQVDYQCFACLQIYNLPAPADAVPDPTRLQLAQSHLLHNCPVLLQTALFLTGLLHDGRLNDDGERFAGPTAGARDLQRTGSIARLSTAGPQSKRAKTKQTPARSPQPSDSDATTGGPAAASTAAACPGSTVGPAGPSTRSRPQPKSQSRQLCTFFQPRSTRRPSEPVTGDSDVARSAQGLDHTADDTAAASDAMPVSGPHGEGDQDLRGQAGGPIAPNFSAESADRRTGELALSGMELSGQTIDRQQQGPYQHDLDDPACERAGGDVQKSRPGDVLPVASDQPGGAHLPMETSTLPPGGPGMGVTQQALQEQRVDPPRDNAETTCTSPMRLSRLDPTVAGTTAPQGERQGQEQAATETDAAVIHPALTLLLHVVSHLRLHNEANWCYANSTILCVLWSLMSMQCDTTSLGAHFETLIQFLPCHNMQPVALTDLVWFDQILQNWDAFTGEQRGRQQDASEYAAAVLRWFKAPAVNMTWERRIEETDSVRVHDHGDIHMPITISFPETNAHLPDAFYIDQPDLALDAGRWNGCGLDPSSFVHLPTFGSLLFSGWTALQKSVHD